MGFDGADYTAEPASDIEQRTDSAVSEEFNGDVEASPYSLVQSLIAAQARTRAQNQETALEALNEDAYLQTATGIALDRKAQEVNVTRRPAIRATGVVEFSRSNAAGTDYTIPSGTTVQTESGDVQFLTTVTGTISSGSTTATVNVRAVEGGPDGNLAANRLVAMPSPPTGVETVTNPNPTGDDNFTDTDGDPYIVGRPEETDEELRERAQESRSLGGAATVDSLEAKLRARDTVIGLTLNVNKTGSVVDGLDPHSFEVVVYAPSASDQEIAQDIFDVKAITDRDVGGVNGVEHTYTVQSDVLASGSETIHFTRAPNVSLNIDLEVVYTDEYVGKSAIKDRIVNFIGGTDTDGARRLGTTIGEDLYVPLLRDTVVGTETGVVGISSLTIDATGDGSDNTTTDADGISILDVASNEVATVDASNITVTEEPQG